MKNSYRRAWMAALGAGLAACALARPCGADPNDAEGSFRVRAGVGAGWVHDSGSVDQAGGVHVEGTITGLSLAGDLILTGSLGSRLSLGGGAFGLFLPSPRADGASASGYGTTGRVNVRFDSGAVVLVGPVLDVAVAPSLGLYVLASAGAVWGMLGQGNAEAGTLEGAVPSENGLGFGGLVGFGKDWRIGNRWTAGVLGQLALVSLSAEDDASNRSSHALLAPSLLVTMARR